MALSSRTGTLQSSIRAAVAAGLSVWLAQLLALEYPIYAMISAVIVTDLSPTQTRRSGWRRLAGTLLGAVVGAALSGILASGSLSIGAAILVAMVLCHLLPLRGAAVLCGYVCG